MKNNVEKVIKLKHCYLQLLIVILFTSCASMSTMQTARTTAKKDFELSYGIGHIETKIPLSATDTAKIDGKFLEMGGRYGIGEKLDMGLKLTIIGTMVLDAKYQFIGNQKSKFASSIGFGIGYMNLSSGGTKANLFDLVTPVIISYHPADWLGIYSSAKYVYRINTYKQELSNSDNINSQWYGFTGGFRFGKRFGFLAEYTYFKCTEQTEAFSQITLGVSILLRTKKNE